MYVHSSPECISYFDGIFSKEGYPSIWDIL